MTQLSQCLDLDSDELSHGHEKCCIGIFEGFFWVFFSLPSITQSVLLGGTTKWNFCGTPSTTTVYWTMPPLMSHSGFLTFKSWLSRVTHIRPQQISSKFRYNSIYRHAISPIYWWRCKSRLSTCPDQTYSHSIYHARHLKPTFSYLSGSKQIPWQDRYMGTSQQTLITLQLVRI